MTQEELSQKAGVHVATIRDLENNRRGAHKETVLRLAGGLGVEPQVLVQESRDEVA